MVVVWVVVSGGEVTVVSVVVSGGAVRLPQTEGIEIHVWAVVSSGEGKSRPQPENSAQSSKERGKKMPMIFFMEKPSKHYIIE